MKRLQTGKHHIDGIFVLLLAGVFAVCILIVLLTGARVYRAVTARDSENYNRRICAQYIAAKIRHADVSGAVYVGDFSGTPSDRGDTLFLTEVDGGVKYCTRIYCSGGEVRELFAQADGTFQKQDGVAVMEAKSLSFSKDPQTGLVTVEAADASGAETSVSVLPRCGGEEGSEP